jgi:hypothetical protein
MYGFGSERSTHMKVENSISQGMNPSQTFFHTPSRSVYDEKIEIELNENS